MLSPANRNPSNQHAYAYAKQEEEKNPTFLGGADASLQCFNLINKHRIHNSPTKEEILRQQN